MYFAVLGGHLLSDFCLDVTVWLHAFRQIKMKLWKKISKWYHHTQYTFIYILSWIKSLTDFICLKWKSVWKSIWGTYANAHTRTVQHTVNSKTRNTCSHSPFIVLKLKVFSLLSLDWQLKWYLCLFPSVNWQ